MVLQLSACSGLAGSCNLHTSFSQRSTNNLPARKVNSLAKFARSTRPRQAEHRHHQSKISAVASVEREADTAGAPSVTVDNKKDSKFLVVSVTAPARVDLLSNITDTLAQLGLQIAKANVDNSNGNSVNKISVCRSDGSKLDNPKQIEALQHALESAISPQSASLKRPLLKQTDKSVAEDKKNFLYTLMGACY